MQTVGVGGIVIFKTKVFSVNNAVALEQFFDVHRLYSRTLVIQD
jgi:hypothetical protein